MTLDNLMNMATADRYTEDGRQQIEDARRTYKPGEISEKTGLQKQNDGTWAPPKVGAAGGQKAPGTTAGKSRYEGIKRLSDLPPEDRLAFRKRHDATTGEGNQYRVVKAGKVMSVKAQSPEEARDVLRIVGNGTIALKDIKEIGKKQPATEPSSKPSPRPKSPAVKNPDVLHMTKSGATKRIQAAGGKLLGEKDGKVWFENSDGGLYNFTVTNGKVSSSSSMSAPHSDADKAEIEKIKSGITGSTTAPAKIDVGSDVKVKVNGGRPGKVTKIRGDVVTVEMPAQGDKPARTDTYYKSDLEAGPGSTAATKAESFSGISQRTLSNTHSMTKEIVLPGYGRVMVWEPNNGNGDVFLIDSLTDKGRKATPEEAKTKPGEKAPGRYRTDGATEDAAPGCQDEQLYTPESISGPREKLERQLTGDTRIRVKK